MDREKAKKISELFRTSSKPVVDFDLQHISLPKAFEYLKTIHEDYYEHQRDSVLQAKVKVLLQDIEDFYNDDIRAAREELERLDQ